MHLSRRTYFYIVILFAELLPCLPAPLTASAVESPQIESTEKDRTDLKLTVYNDNYAFIRETRELAIKAGRGMLEFTGVPATISPETILLRPLTEESGFTVLEQSFHFYRPGQKTLLDKYVGKKIRLEVWNRFNDRVSSVEATLLGNSDGPLYKIGDEIYLGHHGVPVLPELPEGLVTGPEINWLYRAPSDADYRLEVSYLAEKIQWKALYRLILQGHGGPGELTGWISLTNESGTAFTDAEVRFAAGRPHRQRTGLKQRSMAEYGGRAMQMEASQASESPLFEYHIYDLGRRISIKDKEQKQLGLITAQCIEVKKEFEIKGRPRYFRAPLRSEKITDPVYVYLEFINSTANCLGSPLPAGKIDIYMEGDDGELEFIGGDTVDHTPVKRSIRLKAGIAFDVTAKRTQTGYKRISSVLYDRSWEVKIRNNKARAVTVSLVEPLSGSWEILGSSHPYTKTDAFTIKFEVPVPAGEEVSVTYRARVEL
ncbi:MAG: DUF4139 domain-containing protein [Thermodesulfobacteriota bacterium]